MPALTAVWLIRVLYRLLQLHSGMRCWIESMPRGSKRESVIDSLIWQPRSNESPTSRYSVLSTADVGVQKLKHVCRMLEDAAAKEMLSEWHQITAEAISNRLEANKPISTAARKHIEFMSNALRAIAGATNSEEVMQKIASCSKDFVKCEEVWVLVSQPSNQRILRGVNSTGAAVEAHLGSKPSVIASCIESCEVQSCDAVEFLRRLNPSVDRIEALQGGITDALCVPIASHSDHTVAVGVIYLVNHPKEPNMLNRGFTGSEAFVISELASVVSPMLHRAQCTLDAQVNHQQSPTPA